MRSATVNPARRGSLSGCFNPRTPCGVRPISHGRSGKTRKFQSTHSLRSATLNYFGFETFVDVSIHALLAECDIWALQKMCPLPGFNPRTPCGVRLTEAYQENGTYVFQSTHSLRSATANLVKPCNKAMFQSTHSLRSATGKNGRHGRRHQVSIHALLAECDRSVCFSEEARKAFQSTHSLRSATSSAGGTGAEKEGFNPRTPCGVRQDAGFNRPDGRRFNPRTPCGVRLANERHMIELYRFQSTHSLRSATNKKPN